MIPKTNVRHVSAFMVNCCYFYVPVARTNPTFFHLFDVLLSCSLHSWCIPCSLLAMLILFTAFRNNYPFLYKGLLLPSSLCDDMLPIYTPFTFATIIRRFLAIQLTGIANDLLTAHSWLSDLSYSSSSVNCK